MIAQDDKDAVSVSLATVELAPNAAYAQTVLTSGARRQRIETRVAHPGAHAELRLDGVYLLGGQRHADQTSIVTHGASTGPPASSPRAWSATRRAASSRAASW